jgi:bacterioferritin (cytochrome b1)
VKENVSRFVRYAWLEKCAMEAGLFWLNPTPEWEVKEALSLHLYLSADHADMIRNRVSEMRNPPPNMDISPDERLDTFFNELLHAQDTLEKLVGLYGVLKTEMLATYRKHYETTNAIVDYPTRRMLKLTIADEEESLSWGQAAIDALTTTPEAKAKAEAWANHLRAYLQAAGGVMGDDEVPTNLPEARATSKYVPDFTPQRDDRFDHRWNFVFPCHAVAKTEGVPPDERTLALMCKRALEIDVPEAMARMIAEAEGEPWEYYVEMCRQLWDEARHAMMGGIYFEHKGIDWKKNIALHPGFSLRLNLDLTPQQAHTALYVIEQSLMDRHTGKRAEYETAVDADDKLASLFQDYDWADEVLHAQIGRRWIVPKLNMKIDEILTYGRTLLAFSQTIQNYVDRGEQVNWWPDFVQNSLGKPSAIDDWENWNPYAKVTSG